MDGGGELAVTQLFSRKRSSCPKLSLSVQGDWFGVMYNGPFD
jgi:hypothetical protein